jgi:hypothetical protein
MPAEVPVDYGNKLPVPTPTELAASEALVPVESDGQAPQVDVQALVVQAIKDAMQSGGLTTPKPAPGVATWKQLLMTLSQPRNVALAILLGCELFTRVTHAVVPPSTIQTLLDYGTMLSSIIVAYKSEKHSLV